MAGAGVVNRHPGRTRQPSLQDGVLLGMENVLVMAVRRVTIWPLEAQASQLGAQALHRHLPLDVLHQDIAHDPGVAAHLGRQRCDDLLAVSQRSRRKRMTCGVRIRSCAVKGSKPRRREPAGASMTRVRSVVTGGVRWPLCRLRRCRRACLVLARLSGSLAVSMPPGASFGFFGRSFSRPFSARSCRFSSSKTDTRTSNWTTSFFSSSRERVSRSGSGGTDMPLDNHVDPLKESPYISSTQPPTGETDQVRDRLR